MVRNPGHGVLVHWCLTSWGTALFLRLITSAARIYAGGSFGSLLIGPLRDRGA